MTTTADILLLPPYLLQTSGEKGKNQGRETIHDQTHTIVHSSSSVTSEAQV